MQDHWKDLLRDAEVSSALQCAWQDSSPGITGGHEEGGFVLQGDDARLSIARWPTGEQSGIIVPAHAGCAFGGKRIVASFHTHPNTGADYLQEPGETDRRAVSADRDLKAEYYVGEFVISARSVYLICPDAQVVTLGDRTTLLESGVDDVA
jgi:hypothetical protein